MGKLEKITKEWNCANVEKSQSPIPTISLVKQSVYLLPVQEIPGEGAQVESVVSLWQTLERPQCEPWVMEKRGHMYQVAKCSAITRRPLGTTSDIVSHVLLPLHSLSLPPGVGQSGPSHSH